MVLELHEGTHTHTYERFHEIEEVKTHRLNPRSKLNSKSEAKTIDWEIGEAKNRNIWNRVISESKNTRERERKIEKKKKGKTYGGDGEGDDGDSDGNGDDGGGDGDDSNDGDNGEWKRKWFFRVSTALQSEEFTRFWETF